MPVAEFKTLMADLRRKAYAPVYFLMGEEPYYIDRISDFFQYQILDEAAREFDQTVLYGKDTDINTVINIAKRFPMMGGQQVVIVKEAQNIKDWENMYYYMQQPASTTLLVFCYKYGKPDSRKKGVKELLSKAVVFESKKLRDNQVGGWIESYLSERKVVATQPAVVLLAESLGADLSRIAHELDKLMLGMPEGSRTITPELVEQHVGISKEFNVFELQNALINGDVLKANRIINYFADNPKQNPVVLVLGQLFNFFSNLMIYHYLGDKSPSAVASQLKINPYFVKDYQLAARRFSAWKTMNIIALIRDADARSKGFGGVAVPTLDLLKELVYRILH